MKALAYITESFTESVIREMTRICDAAGGYNLSQGFPDFEIHEPIKQAALHAIENGYNQYPVTFGEPELRKAIAKKVKKYNGIDCNPETDITVTCGATEGMIAVLKAIINPGDEIIVFEPFYENYGPDGILSGAIPRYVKLYAPQWRYHKEELTAAFNKKTKAIVINTPNNPTGKVFTKDELSEIASLCTQHDVYAVTDEIYEHILYDGSEHISIATLPNMANRTITISGASKTYSVTGWRIGWVIASEIITERIRKVHDFLTVGAPTPFQHAIAFALDLPQEYYFKLVDRYTKARAFMYDALCEAGFSVHKPQGAYYFFAEIPEKLTKSLAATNDVDFSIRLIEKTGVASVPGSSFYSVSNNEISQVRFCYCKKWETLESACTRLRKLR